MEEKSISAKARIIKERRTIEATRKNLTGSSGKLMLIAKWLGTPIIQQGTSDFYTNYMDNYYYDDYEESKEDEIPLLDDDDAMKIGYLFDGLSRGYHLEIVYYSSLGKLTVNYKGYVVFQEISGDLLAYAPSDDWENIIERLYQQAKDKAISVGAIIEQKNEETKLAKLEKYVADLRQRWGL